MYHGLYGLQWQLANPDRAFQGDVLEFLAQQYLKICSHYWHENQYIFAKDPKAGDPAGYKNRLRRYNRIKVDHKISKNPFVTHPGLRDSFREDHSHLKSTGDSPLTFEFSMNHSHHVSPAWLTKDFNEAVDFFVCNIKAATPHPYFEWEMSGLDAVLNPDEAFKNKARPIVKGKAKIVHRPPKNG